MLDKLAEYEERKLSKDSEDKRKKTEQKVYPKIVGYLMARKLRDLHI